jgi:uncharacterized protein (DUF3084 family)
METALDRNPSSRKNEPSLVRHVKHVLAELTGTQRQQACLHKRVTSLSDTVQELTANLESLSNRQRNLDGRMEVLATNVAQLKEETCRRFGEVQTPLQALVPKIDTLLES